MLTKREGVVVLARQETKESLKDLDSLYKRYRATLKSIAHKHPIKGMEFDDLIQELGLVMIATARTFKPSKKVKYNTYLYQSCMYKIFEIKKRPYEPTTSLDYAIGDGLDIIDTVDSGTMDAFEELLQDNDLTDIIKVLDELKYGFYTKLYLFYGVPQTTIALAEGKHRRHIVAQHANNLKALRETLKKDIEKSGL